MNGHGGPSNGMSVGVVDHRQDGLYPNHSGSSSSTGEVPTVNGYTQPLSYQSHNEEILNHLYHSGFQSGNYYDTILHIYQSSYRLHALILSRSPFLAHLMSTTPQAPGQCVIYVPLEHEPEITQEGFSIALGYLYSSISLNLITPQNARATLAAGCLLGRMDDLCNYAYEVCRQSITMANIGNWLEFMDCMPPPSDGTSTPIEQQQPMPSTAVFGPYAQRLKDDVFHFLVVTLPHMLNVGGQATPVSPHPDGQTSDAGRDALLQVYARVPFDLFKTAVESPTFQIGSDQARFKFAKDAIELRKRGTARGGQGAEETVVLAFGGSNFGGSAVHVTRKLRKRPLWKVNS